MKKTTKHYGMNSLYGIDKFKQGESTLDEIQLREVGDVKGKTLLHLQCHFGLKMAGGTYLLIKIIYL